MKVKPDFSARIISLINLFCRIFLVLTVVLSTSNNVNAQSWLTSSDQWTATDALDRTLPGIAETGAVKQGKFIAMFYWTWHQDGPANQEPHNLTELLARYDEATVKAMMNDYRHANWEGISQFHWDEPLFGFYRTTDKWVLRKHAEMLADAGVDVVFFDCTNGTFLWKESYTALLETWHQARLDGVKTPQIAFLLPFGAHENSMTDILTLYEELYRPGLYQDLWFMWDGKPLIMGYPESLSPRNGTTAGLKFTATEAFYAINTTCPSWNNNIGNLTFRLYKWNNTYSESVNSTPLAEKTFVNFNDNEKIQLTFEKLEAGDYVWELSNGTEEVGVWKWTDGNNTAVSYFNGSQVTGHYESEISYSQAINFTPLTAGTSHEAIAIKGQHISQREVDEMKAFFTFRPGQGGYVQGPERDNHWGWMEVYPQHGFPANPEGEYEQVCVSVAQNASPHSSGQCTSFNGPETFGRNYTANADGSTGSWNNSEDGYLWGANFEQQWERAFELDPELVWVTGWNEWIFGRFENWTGCSGGPQVVTSFPDSFDKFRSRDIEPARSWGNKGDVYYMQLVDKVRQFKGMQNAETVSEAKTIDMTNVGSWADVTPNYRSYRGNTLHRNHAGHGANLSYTNTTGRNDIIAAKVARDKDFVYFCVETDNVLTDKSDPKWMRLFIDIDRDKSTGWEGYDFIINRNSPTDSVLIEKSIDGWSWETSGKAKYTLNEKSLVLKINKSVFGLDQDDRLNFEFKWSDNMQEDGNIMDFYVNGDVAPGGRFNYMYEVKKTDDAYLYGETPEGTNQGLKCELYDGSFDSIPQFNLLKVSETHYMSSVLIPESSSTVYALKYTGFFEADAKDEFTFTLEADSLARLFLNGTLVVETNNPEEEKTGTIKLMPGKHDLKIEYVTGQLNAPKLKLQVQSSGIGKALIPGTMLSKYNVKPQVELLFCDEQNYFSEIDTVAKARAFDPDGNVTQIEIYNDQNLLAQSDTDEIVIKNLDPGEYFIKAKAEDIDGARAETNTLNFEVRPAFAVPGEIKVEAFRKGSSVIVETDDDHGGYQITSIYGETDYPIVVAQAGTYQFTFRVPATTGSAAIRVKINGLELVMVDVGSTGNDKDWFDLDTRVYLAEGVHILELDFEGRVTLSSLDITEATGRERLEESFMQVYPNPSSGDFWVHSAHPLESICVYDVMGKMINQIPLEKNLFTSRVSTGKLPGIYFLHVNLRNETKEVIRVMKN